MALSAFHQFLNESLSLSALNELEKKFTSPKRFNFVLRNPDRVSLEELLFIADSLGVQPVDLTLKYYLGTQIPDRVFVLLQDYRDALEKIKTRESMVSKLLMA